MNELPLQELFTRLREAGLPLGIDEYQLVLQALQAGFGMSDKGALKRLCQTLWIKSAEERRIFEYHFERVLTNQDLRTNNITTVIATEGKQSQPALFHSVSVSPTNSKTQSGLRKISLITRYVILGFLGVGIVLGVRSTSKEQIQENSLNTPTTVSPIASPNPSAIITPTVPNPSVTIIGTQTATLIPTPTKKPQSNTNRNQPNFIFWTLLLILLSIIALSAGYVFFRRVAKRRSVQQHSSSFIESNPSASTSALPPELTQTIKDEVQVAQAVLQTTSRHEEISVKIAVNHFILNSEYFPVTERQMKQMWRYLRRPVREGAASVLDVEATVNQIGRRGLLLEPVLVPPRINRADLLLLIDQDGSMVPFHTLSHRLAETAIRGGRLGKAGIYYFHNCPIEYLYHDRNHLQAELVSHVVTNVCSERTAVLILSDAGAARGGNSEERYKLTQEFLDKLKQQVRYIAWLNPMPKKRWNKTTAGEIARLVPMFEVSRSGLQDAIAVLCGRPTHF